MGTCQFAFGSFGLEKVYSFVRLLLDIGTTIVDKDGIGSVSIKKNEYLMDIIKLPSFRFR